VLKVNARGKSKLRSMSDLATGAGAERPALVRLHFDLLTTPIGQLLIVCDAAALCVVDYEAFGDRMHRLLARRYGRYELVRTSNPLGMTALLDRYFGGDLASIDAVAVNTGGTPYQRRVWDALRTISAGQTRNYAQLATQIGGTHARAVGQANSLNPLAIVVPCHRVIGANAALTGYAGGLPRKRWLLDHEAQYGGAALRFWPSTEVEVEAAEPMLPLAASPDAGLVAPHA
jgi:O-6-methylguanine DNA methyltransferase